jgi:hypothetical protein
MTVQLFLMYNSTILRTRSTSLSVVKGGDGTRNMPGTSMIVRFPCSGPRISIFSVSLLKVQRLGLVLSALVRMP